MFYSIQYEKYYTLEREGEIICFDDDFDDFFHDEYDITMKEIESMEKGVEYVSGDIAIELYRKRYMLENENGKKNNRKYGDFKQLWYRDFGYRIRN